MKAVVTSGGPRHAHLEGFDPHANVAAPAGDQRRLENLCRYVPRPPVAQNALDLTADGNVLLRLRRPWRDGTRAIRFEPSELREKLALMTPRPRANLLLYTAPAAGYRLRASPPPRLGRASPRGVAIDILACPDCGGRLRLVAAIETPAVIEKILAHRGLPLDPPRPDPARSPEWLPALVRRLMRRRRRRLARRSQMLDLLLNCAAHPAMDATYIRTLPCCEEGCSDAGCLRSWSFPTRPPSGPKSLRG